jgi:polysaccharide biosynthesis/export protein
MMPFLRLCLAFTALSLTLAVGQEPQQNPVPGQGPAGTEGAAPEPTLALRPNYVLGAGDQIIIRAVEVTEIGESPYLIDADGNLDLPLLGRVKAGGLTVAQLEATLVELLRKYVQQPRVNITVVQFRREPVFVVGAFKNPGIYPLEGHQTLVEMIASVGGLDKDASRRIKITRRTEFGAIPLPNAVTSPDGTTTSVSISLDNLQQNINPAEDVVLQPYDIISVERAELVYIIFEVGRAAGVELGERQSLSVIQLLSMAGGLETTGGGAAAASSSLGPNPDLEGARVLRPVVNSSTRAAIPVNIKRILEGKDADFPLFANDLLYIPKGPHHLGRDLLITVPVILGIVSTAAFIAYR